MNDLTEKTLATERKYTGKIISVDLLDIELPDGRKVSCFKFVKFRKYQ